VLALWPAVLETVRSANAMLGAVVEDARPVELVGSRLVVAFTQDGAFQQRKAEDSANRTVLTRALAQVTGHELSLDYQLREREATPPPEPLSEEELVRLLKDEFDAEQLADTGEEEDDD